ncbi:glutamate--cysteine ligase [bacterium (Candidatus Blackallbacteria) CG17_big_fil_post_rev_8_21_14_2_50_48_46]|uniref:Glutamate--cysteine ligase n=1 Tax=bacterium (Candidatus Blackallbacteria) CG17_big_fil_post_rev_8_21_14_2_50_48_46 TaxID=2014261 RepID=A0A2M7G0R8_9BACT|nr:MAG: glutamate--cysteine ligase [bacterium (Candidatus Blackallbacteria) CG18_big_fil_WC_8_21_14_2_50_49_26]PIW15075.1 MAG: glutamate--cysteine ligase [bacterium (Candidatus Blackallbacteria) CG17_big_fil_post_rev_8_21_14_2_50_48_46]PIW47602.1 MAG: glutamate--cysteine ligase [bacterium (Candidatus Blackallbacteria) CG13_big_fil_rev_8_21_14_2_50_49_14]
MNNSLSYTQWLHSFAADSQSALLEMYQAGLEREALRVTQVGKLAQTPHPQALGSALTHPGITTDFAEAQIELITPPFAEIDALLSHQRNLHSFSAKKMNPAEMIWFQSMPPQIQEAEIQIAQFGHSHAGKIKEIYRRGLANRYGKMMQIISGIHFNYSFHPQFWEYLHHKTQSPLSMNAFISENYLALMRNYLRQCWILTYLYGAAPVTHPSFVQREIPELQKLNEDTLIGPMATSLRMSRLGYVNSNRCTYSINYNSLTEYLAGLYKAISSPCASFEKLGIQVNGEYLQLNDHILQIENEHYALIRPKQPPHRGERPFSALRTRGIDYVEVRALDINPFEDIGVTADQLHFVRLFLLYCLLDPNPPIGMDELELINENQHWVSIQGRQPGMKLLRPEGSILLKDWGLGILEKMEPLAELMDAGRSQPYYRPLLANERAKFEDPNLTPSAQVIETLQTSNLSYPDWNLKQSTQLQAELKAIQLEKPLQDALEAEVQQSLRLFAEAEAENSGSFAEALRRFLTLKETGLLENA